MSFNTIHCTLAEVTPMAHEVPSLKETVFKSNVLNFIVVVIFLVWLIKKTKPMSVVNKKINEIKNTITTAEESSLKAEESLNEVKDAVAGTEKQVQEIVNDSKKVAARLSDKIKEEIKTEVNELNQKAEKTISNDKSKVNSEIRKDVTKAAFIVAEEHVKNAIDERLHHKYIDQFINDLSNLKV